MHRPLDRGNGPPRYQLITSIDARFGLEMVEHGHLDVLRGIANQQLVSPATLSHHQAHNSVQSGGSKCRVIVIR